VADGLAARERISLTITRSDGREVKALYDPLFKTITMGGMTFPAGELATWTRLVFGSRLVSITEEEK
jgi:hypothetical protein